MPQFKNTFYSGGTQTLNKKISTSKKKKHSVNKVIVKEYLKWVFFRPVFEKK